MANPQQIYTGGSGYSNVSNVPQFTGSTAKPFTMRPMQFLPQQQSAEALMGLGHYPGGPRPFQMQMSMPGPMPMASADIQPSPRSTLINATRANAQATAQASAQASAQARAEIKAKATDELVKQVVAGIVPFVNALDDRTKARLDETDKLIETLSATLKEFRSHSQSWQKSMTEALSKTHVSYSSNIKLVAKQLDGLERAIGSGSCEGSNATIMGQVKETKCMLGDLLERVKDPEANLIELSTHQILASTSLPPNTPPPIARIIHHEMGTSPIKPSHAPSVYHEIGTDPIPSPHIDASICTTPKALPLLHDVETTPLTLTYNSISIGTQSPLRATPPSQISMSMEEAEEIQGVVPIASPRRSSHDCITLVDEPEILGLQNEPDESASMGKIGSILLATEIHGDDSIMVDETIVSNSPPSHLPDDLSPADWPYESPQATFAFFQSENSPKAAKEFELLQDQIFEEGKVDYIGDDASGKSFTVPLTSTPPPFISPIHSCVSAPPSPSIVFERPGSPSFSSIPEDVPNPTSPIVDYSSLPLPQTGTSEVNQLPEKSDSIHSPFSTSTSQIQDRDSISHFQSSVPENNASPVPEEIEDNSHPDKEVEFIEEDKVLTTVASTSGNLASPKQNIDSQLPLPSKSEVAVNIAGSEVILDVPESEGIDQHPPLSLEPEPGTSVSESEVSKELATGLEEAVVVSQAAINFNETAFEYSQSFNSLNTQNSEADDSEMTQLSMGTFEQAQPRPYYSPGVNFSPRQDVTETQVSIEQSGNAESSRSVSLPVQDLRASPPPAASQLHSLPHTSNEGLAVDHPSNAEVDAGPSAPNRVIVTAPTPVSEDKKLITPKSPFSTENILQAHPNHLLISPATSNMTDEEVVSNLVLRESSPLGGNSPSKRPILLSEELSAKGSSAITPTTTPAQMPASISLSTPLVPKVVTPNPKQIPVTDTTPQGITQSIENKLSKPPPRNSVTPLARPTQSRPPPAKSPSITLQSNFSPAKRASLVSKSPSTTQLLSKGKTLMRTDSPIYISSSPAHSESKPARVQSPISVSSGTVASASNHSTTTPLSSLSDLTDIEHTPHRPHPVKKVRKPVNPWEDSDGETDIIPAKKLKKTPVPAEAWEGTQGKEKKKGLFNLSLLNKTGKSAATTKIKKRKGKSYEDSDGYGEEPPLKRARLRLATKQEIEKLHKERETKKEKVIGEDGEILGWSLNKGKEKESIKGKKPETKPVSTSPRKSRKPKEVKVRWPLKIPRYEDGFHKNFVKCDMCATWYHCGCVGIRPGDIRLKSNEIFRCPPCEAGSTNTRPQVSESGSAICGRSDCEYRQPPADVFFVSGIVGRKSKVEGGRGRSYQWLVKWDGYPITQATWEGEDSMTDPQKLIEEFEEAAAREGIDVDEDPWADILLSEAIKGGWQSESE